jgi:hypothetical protein
LVSAQKRYKVAIKGTTEKIWGTLSSKLPLETDLRNFWKIYKKFNSFCRFSISKLSSQYIIERSKDFYFFYSSTEFFTSKIFKFRPLYVQSNVSSENSTKIFDCPFINTINVYSSKLKHCALTINRIENNIKSFVIRRNYKEIIKEENINVAGRTHNLHNTENQFHTIKKCMNCCIKALFDHSCLHHYHTNIWKSPKFVCKK